MARDLTLWFVMHVLAPRKEIIDIPGYLATTFSGKGKGIYLREVLFPESLFVNIENYFAEENKLKEVYFAAKLFGYKHGLISHLPTLKNGRKEFEIGYKMFNKYVSTIFARRLDLEIDYSTETFHYTGDNFIICRKNGIGVIFTGGMAGLVSYYLSKNAEAKHVYCQGRGDKLCEWISKPLSNDTSLFEKISVSPDYIKINKNSITAKRAEYLSLKDAINGRLFFYKEGTLSYKNERHIIWEANIFYFLDRYCNAKLLFESAYNAGMGIARKNNWSLELFRLYLSLAGVGLPFFAENNKKVYVYLKGYPWTELAKDSTFAIWRGFISGCLSAILDRRVMFNAYSSSFGREGVFEVVFKEQ